jgi:hypothetical protein
VESGKENMRFTEYLINSSKVTVQASAVRLRHHNSADSVLLCRRAYAANVGYGVSKVLIAWTVKEAKKCVRILHRRCSKSRAEDLHCSQQPCNQQYADKDVSTYQYVGASWMPVKMVSDAGNAIAARHLDCQAQHKMEQLAKAKALLPSLFWSAQGCQTNRRYRKNAKTGKWYQLCQTADLSQQPNVS